MSKHEQEMLLFVSLQGAIGTLAGFIGYFVVGVDDTDAMFRFTAYMLCDASGAALFVYLLGPRLGLTGRRLMRLSFLVPGALLLCGGDSIPVMAAVYGFFLGLTWSARYWLEMSVLTDTERDSYASRSGALAVAGGIIATLIATLCLAKTDNSSHVLYVAYGVVCVIAGLALGRHVSEAPMVPATNPLGVIAQPEFRACLPLFFVESGLLGVGGAVGSVGAAMSLGSASDLGWVSTVAGLAGAVALYMTRKSRGVHNRAGWLGWSCLAVAISFVLLGFSAWLPALFVAHSILRAAAGPFLNASEHVLNQRALDIRGELVDRIVARDLVMLVMRMGSLLAFWWLSSAMSPAHLLELGSAVLALGAIAEYRVGQTWFGVATRGRTAGALDGSLN
ncbi:hypothetical protein [Caballeronia sp. BCC1704]|uniref:hypothetical protein n=1 Tax=Caballeronia sp. BCC1704 TaxID=2676300 RepID=UPI001589071D|nr:hypothetical protein [Caballeronia sp. BCC1704]